MSHPLLTPVQPSTTLSTYDLDLDLSMPPSQPPTSTSASTTSSSLLLVPHSHLPGLNQLNHHSHNTFNNHFQNQNQNQNNVQVPQIRVDQPADLDDFLSAQQPPQIQIQQQQHQHQHQSDPFRISAFPKTPHVGVNNTNNNNNNLAAAAVQLSIQQQQATLQRKLQMSMLPNASDLLLNSPMVAESSADLYNLNYMHSPMPPQSSASTNASLASIMNTPFMNYSSANQNDHFSAVSPLMDLATNPRLYNNQNNLVNAHSLNVNWNSMNSSTSSSMPSVGSLDSLNSVNVMNNVLQNQQQQHQNDLQMQQLQMHQFQQQMQMQQQQHQQQQSHGMHRQGSQSPGGTIPCPFTSTCVMLFGSAKQLRDHVRQMHQTDLVHSCQDCGRGECLGLLESE
ncbi:hypothetical protein BCR33DRAFT_567851 [Rhizoclosmatium globosum]|uniref:Uncharacterized protein n=1 Tax=Rhizoclosmatium globosum TaxID=329046 RepID=A0A1Y2B648_9FUNG|nr:hypothetical protein BCR33DRAFT_567851 [Rhizoclosmatium globosum]|eukprot:ORY30312.1 hypothetical protein BCR33DRAFT_567851 [Rhizoclosmatium globosum]